MLTTDRRNRPSAGYAMPIKPLLMLLLLFRSFFLFTCLLSFSVSAQRMATVDDYVHQVMKRHGIPGAAVALIKDGQVVHRGYYGDADKSSGFAVGPTTLFDLHSLSKIFASTALFQLIEAGRLSLSDPIRQHLPQLPPDWENVRVDHLLTFSSGLPEIARYTSLAESDAVDSLAQESAYFPPGERFAYVQTNYWLINRLIEAKSGLPFSDFVKRGQFPTNPEQFLTLNEDTTAIPNRAPEYRPGPDGLVRALSRKSFPTHMLGAGGINLTLPAFERWSINLMENQLLQARTREKMWSDFRYDNGETGAYGWIKYGNDSTQSLGFTGGWVVGYRCFPKEGTAVIFLTNGYQDRFDTDGIVELLASNANPELSFPAATFRNQLLTDYYGGKPNELLRTLREYKAAYPEMDLQSFVNGFIGYGYLESGQVAAAIEVFRINAEHYPDHYNSWDSLAEAYEFDGQTDKAIRYYQKSLQLNPENGHAKERLAVLH